MALLAATFCIPVSALLPRRRRNRALVAACTAIVLCFAIGLAVDGPRWQTVPVALASVVGIVAAVSARRIWLMRTTAAFTLLLLTACGAILWSFPRFELPQPTGSAPIGTKTYQWIDTSRGELATPAPDDYRTVVAQAWYPVAESHGAGQQARYFGRSDNEIHSSADGLAELYGIPGFLFQDASRGVTHAVVDAAPEATSSHRTILFSPGLGGSRFLYTTWAEDMASHGYIVMILDHPYDSASVTLGDGTNISSRITSTGDAEADDRVANDAVVVRAADFSFVLDMLHTSQATDPIAASMDFGAVTVAGHSLGGAAAIEAAALDSRFAAVTDIDGLPRPQHPSQQYPPVQILVAGRGTGSDAGDQDYRATADTVVGFAAPASSIVDIDGAAHLSFTDAPLFLPPIPSLFGSMDGSEGAHRAAALTREFLDGLR